MQSFAASRREQLRVHIADEVDVERGPGADALNAVFERGDVVGDFAHIIDGRARGVVELEEQQIRERRARALDLRGEQGLSTHERVEERVGIGQERDHGVESAERRVGLVEWAVEIVQLKGREWWQLVRDECLNRLTAIGSLGECADRGTTHAERAPCFRFFHSRVRCESELTFSNINPREPGAL